MAPEGEAYAPFWMMQHLGLGEVFLKKKKKVVLW